MVGAAVTRFSSFEGLMLIREGATADFIYSSDPFLQFKANDGEFQYTYKEKMYQTEKFENDFDIEFQLPEGSDPIHVEYVKYQKT